MSNEVKLNTSIHPIILEDIESIISNSKINWDKLYSKTILITGATGLIGSYLVYSLLGLNEVREMNLTILILVRNRIKAEKQFGNLLKRDDLFILENDVVEPISYPYEIHYIIHSASTTSPKAMMNDPVGTIIANAGGAYSLLECAKQNKATFLYLSSREIYGNTSPHIQFISENEYGTLNPTLVRSSYPESKRLSETLCSAYHHQYGVEAKIARLAHTYGPDHSLGRSRVWGDFLIDEIHGKNIVLKSNGLAEFSFMYIADAITALYFILLNSDEMVYNVSDSDSVVQVRELAHIVSNLHPEKDIHTIFDVSDNTCYSTSKIAILDTTKIEKLGWKPSTSLKDGLLRTAEVFSTYMEEGGD